MAVVALAGCPKKKGKEPSKGTAAKAPTKAPKATKKPSKAAKPATAKATTPAKTDKQKLPPDVLRARAALLPLKKKLMAELKGAMEKGGFEKAIEACKIKAPKITAELNQAGIKVGRVSHKPRNAKNALQSDWKKELIAIYTDTKIADLKGAKVPPYQLKELDGGAMGYVEPIYVKPLCLSCHGNAKQIPPKVAKLIKAAFPKDQATGFGEGDFRGMFWVTLPAVKAR